MKVFTRWQCFFFFFFFTLCDNKATFFPPWYKVNTWWMKHNLHGQLLLLWRSVWDLEYVDVCILNLFAISTVHWLSSSQSCLFTWKQIVDGKIKQWINILIMYHHIHHLNVQINTNIIEFFLWSWLADFWFSWFLLWVSVVKAVCPAGVFSTLQELQLTYGCFCGQRL